MTVRGQRTKALSHPGSGASNWQDLQSCFLEVLQLTTVAQSRRWLTVWRTFVEHPWYQSELEKYSTCIARESNLMSLREDVRQDAMLLLARQLHTSPDLHYDEYRGKTSFPAWVRAIVLRHCREAARSLRRASRDSIRIDEIQLANEQSHPIEDRIDLAIAIDTLPELERTVLHLYSEGFTIKECSRRLQLNQSATYRALRRGIVELQRRLASHE